MLQQGTKICISNNNWEETLLNTTRVLANFPYAIRRDFGGQTLDRPPGDSVAQMGVCIVITTWQEGSLRIRVNCPQLPPNIKTQRGPDKVPAA